MEGGLVMKSKVTKHDVKAWLKVFNDNVKQNNKDLKENYITLDDYLVSIRDNADFIVKKFQELLDWQE